jgi:RES domain-containing protein
MVGRSKAGGFELERVFRHCAPSHTNLSSTLESNKWWGGRYNPVNEFGAIYVASEEATATEELERRVQKQGVPRSHLLPRLLLTLHLKVQKVLDLTDAAVRQAWGTTLEEITREDDYARCREVARIARRDGYEAIRYPSYVDGRDNYAVFYDVLKPGSDLVIVAERLLDVE